MKAIVRYQYGPPEVLQLAELDRPEPKRNEVLIKVHAVEATKADCELRCLRFPVKWFAIPIRLVMGITKPRNPVLGGYFAGVVESVGADVAGLKPGDAVFGSTGIAMGAYAEYLCLSANSTIVPMPSNISFEEAAAVPLGGLNALHFLSKANVQPGEHVLINGAGGSIGMFGVQIAKAMGAEVTAVDAMHKEAMLRQIGVDHFIDYTKKSFADAGQRYDVVFDMVVQTPYSDCIKVLKPKGRYMMGNPRIQDMLKSMVTPLLSDKAVGFAFAAEKREELLMLKDMIEQGKIKPHIDRVLPMQEAVQAHHLVETEQRVGSIVISLVEPSQ